MHRRYMSWQNNRGVLHMEKVIFNGKIVDRTEVTVDLEDRGYQFGDGVYEVIRVYGGVLFTIQEHLERMAASAKAIQVKMPYTIAEMTEQIKQLIEENNVISGSVYIQLTRGVSPRNHAYPNPEVPAVYIASTKQLPEGAHPMKAGVKTILAEDIRWLRCDIKSLNLLGNIMAKQKAVETGCFEAILHRGEIVTEGSSSNVFIVKDGKVQTHPATNLILNGISRQVLLKLLRENDIPYKEEVFTTSDLKQAEEVFLTSTTSGVLPIVEMDGEKVGEGTAGPLTRQIQALFDDEISNQCGVKNL